MLIGVPWLGIARRPTCDQVGRWTFYGEGNDNFLFQRYSYRVFMQHYWLEGGQVTFWNQPFYRWIVGALHMLFGESSVGQVYWDAAGITIMAMFAFRVLSRARRFHPGRGCGHRPAHDVPARADARVRRLRLVGNCVCVIYLSGRLLRLAWPRCRSRVAGVLVILAFYTRLNNLPMALAVAALAAAADAAGQRALAAAVWWPLVRWRVVFTIAGALALGAVLFAWRTWYYTGVFSVFHGTQREFLAVWKPGMSAAQAVPAMLSSVMMVLTATDPPAFTWHGLPLVAAAVIAGGAGSALPGFRRRHSRSCAVSRRVAGALVTRGWGHEGRFSIHLFGAAAVLCTWGAAFPYAQMTKNK